MSDIGKSERITQDRVIALLRDELGYRYLGDWTDREGNSNIEENLITSYLTEARYSPAQINTALYKLRAEATNTNRGLYANNQAVYSLRKALGEDVLRSSGDDLRLIPGVVGVDVVEFEAAVAGGSHAAAAALYRGPFLDGFFLQEATEFEYWLVVGKTRPTIFQAPRLALLTVMLSPAQILFSESVNVRRNPLGETSVRPISRRPSAS